MTDNDYDGLLETSPDIAPGAGYSMISCFDYLCLSNFFPLR